MLLLAVFVSLKSLSLADHVTEAFRVGGISGKKCLKQEKTNNQMRREYILLLLGKSEYSLGKLDMTVLWLFRSLYGK